MSPVNSTSVTMYGQEKCERCSEVKAALKANGVMFSYEDIRYLNDPAFNPDWRTNGSVDLLAEVNLQGWNGDLPLLKVGNDVVLAADAQEVTIDGHTIPVSRKAHCEDGACKVNFGSPVSEGVAAVA